jgi:hypothetical protein
MLLENCTETAQAHISLPNLIVALLDNDFHVEGYAVREYLLHSVHFG